MSASKKKLIDQVITLIKLIMIAPATNAESERVFSAMKRVKSYLRNKMTNERLNSLMVLHVHKDRLQDLDFIEIGNTFVGTNIRRRNTFGVFKSADSVKIGRIVTRDCSTQTE